MPSIHAQTYNVQLDCPVSTEAPRVFPVILAGIITSLQQQGMIFSKKSSLFLIPSPPKKKKTLNGCFQK